MEYKTIILAYEDAHVAEVADMAVQMERSGEEAPLVVALGLDIEYALEARGVTYMSGRAFRTISAGDRMARAGELGEQLTHDPALSFFTYKDIALGELYTVGLQDYLARLYYWSDIYATLLAQVGASRIVLWRSAVPVSSTSGLFASFEVDLLVDAAQLVGDAKGVAVEVRGDAAFVAKKAGFLKDVEEAGMASFFTLMNTFVRLCAPGRQAILVDDYWKNMSPMLPFLGNMRILVHGRKEARAAGMASWFRFRMGFYGMRSFMTRTIKEEARTLSLTFSEQYTAAPPSCRSFDAALVPGVSLRPLLEKIFFHICSEGGKRAVETIGAAERMLQKLSPRVVLVRASASAQIHFAVLCILAKRAGIPSLEMQHGTFYHGKGSYGTRHAAEYVAEYGPLVREQLRAVGFTDEKLFDVGSPRFDMYAGLPPAKPAGAVKKVLCIVPEILIGSWVDTWEVEAYFKSIKDAFVPLGVVVVLKLRPGPMREAFFRETARRVLGAHPYVIAQYEPMSTLLETTDLAAFCYSTAVLEALLAARPVLYVGVLPMHQTIAEYGVDYQAYISRGMLRAVYTQPELDAAAAELVTSAAARSALISAAGAGIQQLYCLDGASSKRLSGVVKQLASQVH